MLEEFSKRRAEQPKFAPRPSATMPPPEAPAAPRPSERDYRSSRPDDAYNRDRDRGGYDRDRDRDRDRGGRGGYERGGSSRYVGQPTLHRQLLTPTLK